MKRMKLLLSVLVCFFSIVSAMAQVDLFLLVHLKLQSMGEIIMA